MERGGKAEDTNRTQTTEEGDKNKPKPLQPIAITNAQEYVASGNAQAPEDVPHTYDGDSSTYWRTKSFTEGPELAPYKPGVGIVYDLGSARTVSAASIGLRYVGDRTTVHLYAVDSLSPSDPLDSAKEIGTATGSGDSLTVKASKKVKTQYVLLWITHVPYAPADDYSNPGFKQALTDVKFTG
jgi:hypothetical protein